MEDKSIGVPINSITEKSTPAADDRFLLDTPEGPRITKWGNIEAMMRSGIKGVARPTSSSPTPWKEGDPYLFEIWKVTEAGTYTNFGGVIVTEEDLKNNFVTIDVTNGVSKKEVSEKPFSDYKEKFKSWVLTENFTITSDIVYDSQGNFSSANITFPDNILGNISITRNDSGSVVKVISTYKNLTADFSITRNYEERIITSIIKIN